MSADWLLKIWEKVQHSRKVPNHQLVPRPHFYFDSISSRSWWMAWAWMEALVWGGPQRGLTAADPRALTKSAWIVQGRQGEQLVVYLGTISEWHIVQFHSTATFWTQNILTWILKRSLQSDSTNAHIYWVMSSVIMSLYVFSFLLPVPFSL